MTAKKTTTPRARKPKPKPVETLPAFKGFDTGYKCRGFQYEIGQTYRTERSELCETGFHACENPIDVFRYYPPSTSVFAQVDLHGDIKKGDDKACASGITIKAALTLPGIIQAAVDFTFSRTKPADGAQNAKDGFAASNSGTYGAASNSGTSGAASNSGKDGIAAAFGLGSTAMSTEGGIIIVAWWDQTAQKKRVTTGYPGENGVKADTWYGVNDAGMLVELP